MTFDAKAIMTPTSEASMGFIEPDDRGGCAAAAEPKSENNTLASERFMALAMNCVSSVPAEPTTVPAMIIAALFEHEAFEGHGETGERVVQRDDHRHVGAADGQRHGDAEQQRQREDQRDVQRVARRGAGPRSRPPPANPGTAGR